MSGIVRKGSNQELTEVMSMRLSVDDRKLLETVSAMVPVLPTLTLARVALRIGLETIRRDPARALGATARQGVR